MTPFVEPLRDAVGTALGDWLGGELRWRPGGGGITVEVGVSPTVRVRLDTGPRVPGSIVREDLRLAVDPPGADTLRDPRYRARLGALVTRFERGDAAPYVAALAAWRPYALVDDQHYRRLARSTQGLTGMLRLGFRCNQDCGFCWQGRSWPAPPEGLYWTWIDEIAAGGATRLTLSGGEPTLYARLPELIAHARARGLLTHLQTNAIKLRKPEYLQALVAAGLDGVLVSFHASDAGISDRMTRAPGTWRHTLAGIHTALAAGVAVALNCVVDAHNVAHLPDHAAFIYTTFVAPYPENPVRVVNYSHPSPYWDGALWADTLASFEVTRVPLGVAVQILEAGGVTVHAAGTCGFPLCVLPRGSQAAAGVDPETADRIDASARTYAPVCADCSVRGRCPGVRPEVMATFGAAGLEAR